MVAITGSAGATFNLTDTDLTSPTGNKRQLHRLIAPVTVTVSDIVASWSGTVGVTEMNMDLTNLDNIEDGFGEILYIINETTPITTASAVKIICVQNYCETETIIVKEAAVGDSFFPAGEQITVLPGSTVSIQFSTPVAIVNNMNIGIISSGAETTCRIFLSCTGPII